MSHGRARLALMEHSEILERLASTARAHHGVFTIEHARAAGMSDAQVFHRVEDGQWVAPFRNVYRWAATPASWEGDLLGACWAGGFRALASHRSAAALWGLPGRRRDLIEISCPRWRRARHESLVVHETKVLDGKDVRLHRRIPVTSVERTLLDLGAVCPPVVVKMALDDAEHRGLTTLGAVDATLRRLARPGRPGVRPLRDALWEAAERRGVPESAMESRMVDVIRRHGLPTPVLQFEVRDERGHFVARVDAAYPEHRVAIEYDSKQEHTGEQALQRDSSRRNRIIRAGFLPVTARYGDLKSGGGELCSTLAALLAVPPNTLASLTRSSRE